MKTIDLDFENESHYKTAKIMLFGFVTYIHHDLMRNSYQLNWIVEDTCLTKYALSEEELNILLGMTETQLIITMNKK